jgi:hypothetical protein
MKRAKFLALNILLWAAFSPGAMACAVCGGQSDAPMAKGMNWGIFSLLAVIGMMLSLVATFFVFLAKKSAQVAATESEQILATKNI